jgi:hypothetical protein
VITRGAAQHIRSGAPAWSPVIRFMGDIRYVLCTRGTHCVRSCWSGCRRSGHMTWIVALGRRETSEPSQVTALPDPTRPSTR